jgi:hypothetical protein
MRERAFDSLARRVHYGSTVFGAKPSHLKQDPPTRKFLKEFAMKRLALTTVLALAAMMTLTSVMTPAASAGEPKALLFNPNPGYNPSPSVYLPKFGFNSFNVGGYGERVTNVQWGGLAAQLGLESGDTILSLNGFGLTYHGAWNDALYQAMSSGGFVQLQIRDVRTGWVITRSANLGGGYGPVTSQYHVTSYGPTSYGPTTSHIVIDNGYTPVGPITTKKMVNPPKKNVNNLGNAVQQVVKLIEN